MFKTIENITFTNQEKAIVVSAYELVTIHNVHIDMINLPESSPNTATLGCDFRRCGLVDIDGLFIKAVSILRKYAYGLRLGYSNAPLEANKLVRIKNSRIEGFGPASADYSKFNHDGIALEGGELWLKDTVISDMSDACLDCKGSVKAKNCTFEKGYRDIRIWPNQVVTLSNCKVGTVWFQDNTGKLVLFNTLPPTRSADSAAGIIEIESTDPLTDSWFLSPKRLNLTPDQLDYLKTL